MSTAVVVGLQYCAQFVLKSILKLVLRFPLELINLLNFFNRFNFLKIILYRLYYDILPV